MALSQDEVITYLSNLTVIDLVNLTKALEDKWGVKAAPVAVAAAAGPAAGAAATATGAALTPHLSSSAFVRLTRSMTVRFER